MTPDEKITSLLVKLNRLTSLDKIKWEVTDPPRSIARGTDDFIPLFLTATYKNQRFGLFQQRYQSFDGDRERHYWSERLVLAILDSEGRVLLETPQQSSALFDLFETARKKVANIDDVINNLLVDDDASET